MKKAKDCTLCGEAFNKEERADPRKDWDGDPICDTCWSDNFEAYCFRCDNLFEKTELEPNPGRLILIVQEAPSLGGTLSPGYYRVKEWPLFADGMIEGYFFDSALQRVAGLDEKGQAKASVADASSGPICQDCQKQAERMAKWPRVTGAVWEPAT